MTQAPDSAVVFAYSEVGVRGLAVLLAQGMDIRLVVSHDDDPKEQRWFASVTELAGLNDIPVITPADPNVERVIDRVRAAAPDWILSLYYRHLLGPALLAIPRRGAYNLHGSLLPRYRGRAPVNWAILRGEKVTGASLHRMTARADAGDLVDQQAVAILPNDTALDVSRKVAMAAEMVLERSLPCLSAGTASHRPLDLEQGSYFGGRTAEDGRIDWSRPASAVHNLIRAVAPPFPGAFTDTAAGRVVLLGSYYRDQSAHGDGPRLYWQAGACWADCRDQRRLRVLGLALNGASLSEAEFQARFGAALELA